MEQSKLLRLSRRVGLLAVCLGIAFAGALWAVTPKQPGGSYLDQKAFFKPELYISSSHEPVEKILTESYLRFPRLKERRRQLAGSMSGGEQQMLSLARALSSDPALLLLDELSMGLAPLIVESLYETVAEIARDGVSILVVEQFASSALRVADYAAVMQGGRIIETGEPREIESKLNELYFGGAA